MAIAANFRKFPHVVALQLVLPLGRPVWNTKRPTSRRGRAFRAYITKQMAALGLRREIVKQPIPQWWKDAQARAKALSKKIKESCMRLELVRDYQEEYIKKLEERKISKEKKVEYVKHSMLMYWSNTENRAWA